MIRMKEIEFNETKHTFRETTPLSLHLTSVVTFNFSGKKYKMKRRKRENVLHRNVITEGKHKIHSECEGTQKVKAENKNSMLEKITKIEIEKTKKTNIKAASQHPTTEDFIIHV